MKTYEAKATRICTTNADILERIAPDVFDNPIEPESLARFLVPVAYSCKLRGFCPSCGAKRQAETVSHLTDNVLPKAPFLQWVTTFPYQLRFWIVSAELARERTNRSLTNDVHKIVSKEIMSFYERRAEDLGITDPKHGGSTGGKREFRIISPITDTASAQTAGDAFVKPPSFATK